MSVNYDKTIGVVVTPPIAATQGDQPAAAVTTAAPPGSRYSFQKSFQKSPKGVQAGVACDEDKDEEPYGPDFVEEQEEVEVLPPEGEGSSEDESSEGEDDEDLPPHRNRIAPRGTAPVRALTEYEAMLANVGISE